VAPWWRIWRKIPFFFHLLPTRLNGTVIQHLRKRRRRKKNTIFNPTAPFFFWFCFKEKSSNSSVGGRPSIIEAHHFPNCHQHGVPVLFTFFVLFNNIYFLK
jgi:hypothetical protein